MAEDETEGVAKLPPDAGSGSLDERLERAQQAEAAKSRKAQPDPSARLAQTVVGYLIGGPLGGGLIGWGLDSLFGTFPLFLLLLLFLGFGVGIRNVMRISKTPPAPAPGAGV